MTDLFREPDGATPLEPGERDGLLQSWITRRSDLNEAEQENIVQGAAWARRQALTNVEQLLKDEFARALHKRMFGDVWRWAGRYRHSERNIGIQPHRIGPEVANLLRDVRYWLENATYPPDEVAVRLHHRFAAIHPFPNGNGRHARLMADLVVERLGREPFSWGGGSLEDVRELRTKYVDALRAADEHEIGPLLIFARS